MHCTAHHSPGGLVASVRTRLAIFLLLAVALSVGLLPAPVAAQILIVQRRMPVVPVPSVPLPSVQVHIQPASVGIYGPAPILRRPLLPRRRLALDQELTYQAQLDQQRRMQAPPRAPHQPRPLPAHPQTAEPTSRFHGESPQGALQPAGPEPTLAMPNAAAAQQVAQRQLLELTPAEIVSLNDPGLLNALHDSMNRLQADVNEFNTGEGWQRYLKLPSDALPPPRNGEIRLGMRSLKKTLARFDSVSKDPQFVKISSLRSFVVGHAALGETVSRYDRPELAQPTPAQQPVAGVPTLAPPETSSPVPAETPIDGPAFGSPTPGETAPGETTPEAGTSEALPAPAANAASDVPRTEHSVLKKITQ